MKPQSCEELIEWCVERSARISFGIDYYPNRVRAKIGGYPHVERDTLKECVDFLIDKIRSSSGKVKTMSKILLDGYGMTLKAVRGVIDKTCPYKRDKDEEGYREIIIETNNGNFIIHGCSQCGVLSWFIEKDDKDD